MLGHYNAILTLHTYTLATRQIQEKVVEKIGNFMVQVT